MEPLQHFVKRTLITLLWCSVGLRPVLGVESQSAPAIYPAGGVFASNPVVSITSTGEVRYTLDGSLPATNSALYSTPLTLSNSCWLQARAFASGRSAGALAAVNFTRLETNLSDFSSTLPLVVIQTFGHSFHLETNLSASLRVIEAETGRPAAISASGNFEGRAAVKVRGYTSRRYPKHSFTVELRDSSGESLHAALLGLPKDSDWILYAPYPDKSLLRDVLAYEISNQMGRYASRTRFVELFLNETTNRLARAHYAGVYVLEEKIKRGQHRVNVQKLSPDDKTEPGITGGYIFKKDHLEQVDRDEPPPPPPATALAHPRPARVSFPTGPGGFPADPAGFLPPREDIVTVTEIVTKTNIAQITNLVAVTNLTLITQVAAATNVVFVTNIAALTNLIIATNVATTRQITTVTNFVSATNISSVTNIASIANQAPFAGVMSFTNVTAFTNVALFTNLASITNSASVTNLASHTLSATITNISALTNIASITNVASATNLELTSTLIWATNVVSVTNLLTVTNTPLVTAVPAAVAATNPAPLPTNVVAVPIASPVKAPLLTRLVETGRGFVSSRTNAFFFIEPKANRITPEQRVWLTNFVNHFERALYGPDFRHPTKGYAPFIDVGSFIDHHLIVEATKNIDGFRFSTFFSKERGGKLKMEPIWDWDLAFGNANGKQGDQFEHWYWPQLDDHQYSWFRRLFDDPDFGQRYVDRWAELRTSVLATTNLAGRVDVLAALLKEPAARNFERWPILGQMINTEPFAGKTYDDEIVYLKGWLSNRLAWVSAQFLPPPVAYSAEPAGLSAASLIITSAVGRVYFTLDGTDPRQPGGAMSMAAQLFQQPLPVTNNLQIFARTQKDARWSSPLKTQVMVKPTATAAKGP